MTQPRVDVITFFGDIAEPTIGLLIDMTQKAKLSKTSAIYLKISSTGGLLHAGFAAYQYLRSLNVPIITYNFGNVESAAMLLYLAGDMRYAAPHSTFLLHDFNWTFPGGPVRAGALREHLQSLDFDSERYAAIFEERTQKGFDVKSCLRGASARLDTPAAIDAGIVTAATDETVIPEMAFQWWIVPVTAAPN